MLKLDLQTFAEDEDTILPDDFEDTPTNETQEDTEELEAEETEVEDTTETKEEPEPTEPTKEEAKQFKLKLKYNSEELEIDEDKARELAQKGMNYDKAVERAKQESLDEYIAKQGHEWNGKPVKTMAEYERAVAEQELMNKYKDQDLPEEVIKELVESKRFREQSMTEKQQSELKNAESKQYTDFTEMYPDVKAEDVKPETWLKAGFSDKGYEPTGVSLKHAYMEQERAELLSKVKVKEQNETNKQRAPVKSVSNHGTEEGSQDVFLTGFDSI